MTPHWQSPRHHAEYGKENAPRAARPGPGRPMTPSPGRDDAKDDDDDMDQWVKEVADALPPLTDRQRDRLARLLHPPRNRAA
jgi:hypothetical protein